MTSEDSYKHELSGFPKMIEKDFLTLVVTGKPILYPSLTCHVGGQEKQQKTQLSPLVEELRSGSWMLRNSRLQEITFLNLTKLHDTSVEGYWNLMKPTREAAKRSHLHHVAKCAEKKWDQCGTFLDQHFKGYVWHKKKTDYYLKEKRKPAIPRVKHKGDIML